MSIFNKIVDSILGSSDRKSVYDVFTPNQEATGNHFLGRFDLLASVESALAEPGAQIFIYGAPGTGKSSLALRALEKAGLLEQTHRIHFPVCTDKEEFLRRLWKAATGSLPRQYEVAGTFKATIIGTGVDAGIKEKYADSLSSESVAEEMLKSDKVFLLDDVERISSDTYSLLADVIKKMTDLRWKYSSAISRVICVAAMRDIGCIFDRDPSASSRIKKFLVRELTPSEMRLISKGGFSQLYLETDDTSLSRIHYYSSGFPRVLHKICAEVASHALKANLMNGEIRLFIQTGLEHLGGDGSIDQGIESARKKIAESSRISGQPFPNIERIAIASAILIQDLFDTKEIANVIAHTKTSSEALQACMNRLCETKLLEAVSGDKAGLHFAFTSVTERLGLRFLTAKAGLSEFRLSKEYQEHYKRLSGAIIAD